MGNTNRPAAGLANGSLQGRYPDSVGIGIPNVYSYHMGDDFIRAPNNPAGTYGDLLWTTQLFGAAGVTYTAIEPTAETENGILQVQTAAAAADGAGGSVGFTATLKPFFRMPIGSVFAVKLRLTSAQTNLCVWSGFFDSATVIPYTGNVNSGVGIRAYENAGIATNWFGVVRNGAVESTVDLGIGANATWQKMGFRRTANGFQFLRILNDDTNPAEFVEIRDVGTVINTNLPVTTLRPITLGVVTRNAVQKTGQIDFWEVGGRFAR